MIEIEAGEELVVFYFSEKAVVRAHLRFIF